MIEISVSEDFRNAGVRVTLGCIQCAVKVEKRNEGLGIELEKAEAERLQALSGGPVSEVPQIAAARRAYRAFGKDPARYRVSSEALMRRLVKGQGIYRINSVVDTNNLISLRTGHSVGAFTAENLNPPIIFRKAGPAETYTAIGRGPINLENLPVFADALGPFGSPTSDSERSMISLDTKTLLLAIIAFGGDDKLADLVGWAADKLTDYCGANDIETQLISV
jgi:DNA/RNA-binding domain of Phe-tRNA-synthetase-like protein